MKTKIVGILVCTLLIATALPAVGTMNEITEKNNDLSKYIAEPSIKRGHVYPMCSSEVEWNETYGGDEFDELRCVDQTDDGGYIASGTTEESDSFCTWVLKVDSDGNEEWNWTMTEIYYNETLFNSFTEAQTTYVQQTSDGGYVVCYYVVVTYNEEDYYISGLIKLNADGEEEWIKSYGDGFDWGFGPMSLIEVDDKFIVVGNSGDSSYTTTDWDACLMKTDEMGVEQWHKEYRYGAGDDETWAICDTGDGYLLTGWADIGTHTDYWMIKTDSDGNEEWNKTFGGSNYDFGHSRNCFKTSDGGYIMCGYTYSYGAGDADLWIVKTDEDGNMDWNKTYGDSYRDVCWSMESTDDGYVCCMTNNFMSATGQDIFLIMTDDDGNTEWIQRFEWEGSQFATYIDETSDGGFIVSGRTGSWMVSNSDGLLIKVLPIPILEIEVTGGIGVKAEFTNTGTTDAIGVEWETTVVGGILEMINKTVNGTIDVEAGKSETVSTGLLLGLGGIEIAVTARSKEVTAEGTQIIIFTLIK